MSGKKTMKKKFKTPFTAQEDQGVSYEWKSKTMPDMENDPRTVLKNHIRGINPITGAVLDSGHYYGDHVIPYQKDLTYEELYAKRQELNKQLQDVTTKIQQSKVQNENAGVGEPDDNGEGDTA